MPEKCALSHGSDVLGRDPPDRLLEPSCGKSVHCHTVSAWGGWGGDTIGGGGVGEPRTGIIYDKPESPNEGACWEIHDEPESPKEGACSRYMMNRGRERRGRV